MDKTELEQARLGIGTPLREARKTKGITQEQLAKFAETNQAVIHKIENGKSLQPRMFNRLALVLDVNPVWIQWGDRFAEMRLE